MAVAGGAQSCLRDSRAPGVQGAGSGVHSRGGTGLHGCHVCLSSVYLHARVHVRTCVHLCILSMHTCLQTCTYMCMCAMCRAGNQCIWCACVHCPCVCTRVCEPMPCVCVCVPVSGKACAPSGGGEEEGTAKPLCRPPGQVWLGKGGQGDGKLIVTERAGDTAQPRNMLYLLRGTS